jgi:patatin-related protein
MLAGHELLLEQAQANEKTREVRLGLVMYGGVSLAVYINGVVQEFFNAVRGRGIYRIIKALTDSDIVVDVISGTSAGGINGILLANALCEGKELAPYASLWREHGDLGRLLQPAVGASATTTSLLNGDKYYLPKLVDAFESLGAAPTIDSSRVAEDPSTLCELDLFVTGTDVDGIRFTEFDHAGDAIDVKDHRALFQLKYRPKRASDLGPQSASTVQDRNIRYQAMARLARITSCFPAAFSPVKFEDAAPDANTVDAFLKRWGWLHQDAYFIDGGVLDNKPFGSLLRSVFARHALREVDRKVFFVEPDPDVFKTLEPGDSKELPPNFFQTILASTLSIPRYETISDDLRALAERNRLLARYNRIVADLQPYVTDAGPAKRIPDDPIVRQLYERSRLIALSDRIVAGLLKTGGRAQIVPQEDRAKASQLTTSFDALQPDADQIFKCFDIEFRLRRLYRVVYAVYACLFETGAQVSLSRAAAYRSIWQAFNRQIELYEVILAAVERMLDDAPIRWAELQDDSVIWQVVKHALEVMLDERGAAAVLSLTFVPNSEWLGEDALANFNAHLAQLSADIQSQISADARQFATQSGRGFESLLLRLDACEQEILTTLLTANPTQTQPSPTDQDPIYRAYMDFEDLDARVFPLELVGGLREKDIIETIRISPRDAQRGLGHRDLSDKVAGDAVFHFGAFFKRSWRSNDILWGRLDGVCQLTIELLQSERLSIITQNVGWRERVRDRFFQCEPDGTWMFRPELDPSTIFADSGEQTHDACKEWLQALLIDGDAKALEGDRFANMLELFVEAAQLQAVQEELQNVFGDALAQQYEWRTTTAMPVPSQSTPKSASPDAAVAAAAIKRKVADLMLGFQQGAQRPARPSETPLGDFFIHSYKVGSETLAQDIPLQVLLELLATALLVTRTCVLNVFGEKAGVIRANPLYKFGIDWPLRAFYGIVFAMRTQSTFLALLGALGVCAITLLVIGIIFSSALVFTVQGVVMLNLLIFYLAPVVALIFIVAAGVWLARSRPTVLKLTDDTDTQSGRRFLAFRGRAVAQRQ